MEKIELLAPAGNIDRLKIAYLYGADACYIGGEKYSLRANAKNFSIEEIKEAAKLAHKLKKKLYVTVNIIFHNDDLKDIKDYLKELKKAKVDACIIADLFLIPILKELKMKFFISTQTSTTNYETVKFLQKLGADRIVLARELTKDEIKEIYDKTHAHLEVFLHGAMCTCMSGRCIMSNYFTNRDSNRGSCAQVCRFTFDLDKKRKTPFSIATCDLNLAKYINDVISSGAKSLKVEGRMRSEYYIATVISAYRKLIDASYNKNFNENLLKREIKILNRVANRKSTSQYFNKKATYKDQYYSQREEKSNQDFKAIVLSYDNKNKLAKVEQRNYFKVKDKLNVFGPNNIDYSFTVNKIYNENMEEVKIANHPKEILYIKIDKKIPKDSMIRKIV